MNTGIFPSQETATRWRFRRQVFTSSGNWNRPANVRDVQVEICGGGGSGATNAGCPPVYLQGGAGGSINALVTNVPSRVTVTVGAGPGGTSSFGSMITCTGGTNGAGTTNGSNGSATIAGNVISNGSVSWLITRSYGAGGQNYGSPTVGSSIPAGDTGAQGVVIVSWMEPVL